MNTLFPQHLTRSQFLLRGIVWNFLLLPIEIYFAVIPFEWTFAQLGALLLLFGLVAYYVCYIALPRATDVGLSRSTALVLSITPGINFGFSLFLLFTRSDAYTSE